MADKTTVKELYISLGLDFSQLDKDYIDADRTVKQNIAKLRAEKNRVSIQMDIDTKNLGPAATEVDKLRIQEQALTKQMELQKQVLALSSAEYAKMVQEKGAAAASSSTLHTALLKEERAVATLNNTLEANRAAQSAQMQAKAKAAFDSFNQELRASQEQMTRGKSNGWLTDTINKASEALKSGSGLKGAAASVGESFTSMAGVSIKALAGVTAVITGIIAGIRGIVSAAMYAAEAGERVYKLSQRMHITTQEAGQLSSILKLGGVDVTAFTSTMIRLEKSVLGVGAGGSEAAETLKHFGVSLTDQSGKLLPMNEQLAKLAEGYQNAAKTGEEEVFVAQVLGARGQELIPIIQNYSERMKQYAQIHPIGPNDIQAAHEMTMGLDTLDQQWTKIKIGVADVFVPLVNKFIPLAIAGFNLVIDAVRTLKGAIESISDGVQIVGNMFSNFTDTPLSQLYEKSKKQLEEKKKAEADAAKARAEEEKKAAGAISGVTQAEQKEREEALKEAKRQAAEIRKVRADVAEETFKLSHSAIVNEMLDIEKKARELKAKGVEEVFITQYTEAAKAKAIQDFNNNTLAKIKETYNTSLQNRLDNIEREKQAWKEKGVAEVEATRWAEEEKLNAVRNAALEAIKSDRKRLEEVREAMSRGATTGYGIDANGNKVQFNFKNGNAMQQLTSRWIAEEQAKLGIKPGETFSPELMKAYQEANKYMKGQLIPGLESKIPLGGNAKIVNNSPQITVNIDKPFIRDAEMMKELREAVAGDIKDYLELRFGGGNNGY